MSGVALITVTVDGVAHEVTPTAGDLVRLEREFGIVASSMTEENTSITWIMFLAFAGLKRTKVLEPETTFDEFLDRADTGGTESVDPSPPLPPPSSAE